MKLTAEAYTGQQLIDIQRGRMARALPLSLMLLTSAAPTQETFRPAPPLAPPSTNPNPKSTPLPQEGEARGACADA